MAMAAHNPAFARKKGIKSGVAREFNNADKRTGILRKATGGRSPMQSGMDDHTNFGQGRGKSMFSTMPLLGHAMSGTQLGQADSLIRKSQAKFAEGGSVKSGSKPAKPQMSENERREVRDLIERGKTDAVASLRGMRETLLQKTSADDPSASLAKLSQRLAAKPVPTQEGADPAQMSREYQALMSALDAGEGDPKKQMAMVDRLAQLSDEMEKLGIPVASPG